MDNFLKNSASGASACFIATGSLNPLEVIKIQIQTDPLNNRGLFNTARNLYNVEGFWEGLMKPGLLASCSREILYSSVRFAIYPDLRAFFRQSNTNNLGFMALGEKFGAGFIAGAVGSSIANPTDLLKIRMQCEPGAIGSDGRFLRGPRQGQLKTYKSTFEAIVDIFRKDGVKGFYRGVSATCIRSSLLTAGQLSSYDHSKQMIKASGILTEGIPLHVTSSVISGLVAATFCAPADRIKTLMMTKTVSFKEAFIQIVKQEGIRGFYRGLMPSYFRLAPHFIISLPLNEQFRKLLGLDAF